ncbi:SMODS domain-containing nucleotidyltransferase [Cupriavidus neocaledonicus]|uniref:Adenylyl/Guanylyl and SMODS C-terminal sensor domain-containing protein n=1 Tax=Cupriavidus neocaledonicus TaxID=1040979 RepID=A0ABY1V3Q0_9BURK|nr:nucleotidyltransferase [Cupriavidus neocaledonicus]SOZ36223.1 conserved hypothetical protein [Cupriavidus neocaledonicus]
MSSTLFEQFRKNLAVANQEDISTSYAEITKRLNKDYWDSSSETANSLQVGSYGRQTAIRNVSDLDMIFELPQKVFDRVSEVQNNGPSQLLQEIRQSIKARYPNTKVNGDGQVVVVSFGKYVVEVLPAFLQMDGSYRYGDSNNGGSWNNYCLPRKEISAVNEVNKRCNRNLKRVAKMVRAWKNVHGAAMSGMLIDTLVYNFFRDNTDYDQKSYGSYPELVRDIFSFLANRPEQQYWLAPGSNSRVATKGKFQRKAKKAAAKAQEALDADNEKTKQRLWREIFGPLFPSVQTGTLSKAFESYAEASNTEQYIEDENPVDIQYELEIGYDVAYAGKHEARIKFMEKTFPWLKLGRNLEFFVVDCNVPEPYEMLWKVRNVGLLAEKKNQIRGELMRDAGRRRLTERTSFGGHHFVECYVLKDNVCVARDRIEVPIELS